MRVVTLAVFIHKDANRNCSKPDGNSIADSNPRIRTTPANPNTILPAETCENKNLRLSPIAIPNGLRELPDGERVQKRVIDLVWFLPYCEL